MATNQATAAVMAKEAVTAALEAEPSQIEAGLLVDGLPGRFHLHHQPVVDLQTDHVVGAEALLRWWHPDHGMLRPGASLAGTRWDGRLHDLEDWALRAGARQAAAWADRGAGLTVAVNVSARHLARPGLAAVVDDAVTSAGISPRLLAVDVPLAVWSSSPAELAAARRSVQELSEVGVEVVLDGAFGAVDPWLVRDLRIDVVKVVLGGRGCRAPGLHPAVAVARSSCAELGARSVAKAVETSAELVAVGDLGFDAAFGHVYGPALTPEAFDAVLTGGGGRIRPLRGGAPDGQPTRS